MGGPADRAALAYLRRHSTAETDRDADDDSFDDRFARWFDAEADRRRFWLAEVDQAPVGMLNLVLFERMPRPGRDPGRWGYISNMFVLPEHRDRGIGALLRDAALAEAAILELDRVVLHPSARSIPFWRRGGFVAADELLICYPGVQPRVS